MLDKVFKSANIVQLEIEAFRTFYLYVLSGFTYFSEIRVF